MFFSSHVTLKFKYALR